MYKSLRLSVIATLLLATTALTIISYNILNPKPLPEPPVVAVPEPPVVAVPEPKPKPKQRTSWVFPRREEPIRITTPKKEGGFTVRRCANFECQ